MDFRAKVSALKEATASISQNMPAGGYYAAFTEAAIDVLANAQDSSLTHPRFSHLYDLRIGTIRAAITSILEEYHETYTSKDGTPPDPQAVVQHFMENAVGIVETEGQYFYMQRLGQAD